MKLYIIDIDGCLNYYPKTKIDYANYYFKLEPSYLHPFRRFRTLDQIKSKLTKEAYEKMTDKYRESNYKHEARVNTSLAKLIRKWYKQGNRISIITAREGSKFMEAKTKEWLSRNRIPYHDLVFTKSKQSMLKKLLEEDISKRYTTITMIDDNLNNLAKCEDMYEALLEKCNYAKCTFIWVKHKYNKKHKYEISRYSRIQTKTYKDLKKEAENGRKI